MKQLWTQEVVLKIVREAQEKIFNIILTEGMQIKISEIPFYIY